MVPGDEVGTRGSPSPPFRWGRRLAGIGAGLGALGLFQALTHRPTWAEGLGEWTAPLGRAISLASGAVPFPVAEVVVLLVVARQVVGAGRGLLEVRRREDTPPRALGRGLLRVGQDAGVLLALFVVLWGVHYARPGLADRLALAPAEDVPASEIRPLARLAVETANELYVRIHGTGDIGSPTQAPPRAALHPELARAWTVVAARHGLSERAALSHGPPKGFFAGSVLRRFGVGGMYFPFTGEALVLRTLPGIAAPRNLAHEMAHQRGFAVESDANVLAFLVAREARHPVANYSAYVFLQRQLLDALARQDPEAALALVEQRLPGVKRDVRAQAEYWQVARGWSRTVGRSLNHAMLSAHGVPGGVANYRGSTGVFLALARAEGPGALFPEMPGAADGEDRPGRDGAPTPPGVPPA